MAVAEILETFLDTLTLPAASKSSALSCCCSSSLLLALQEPNFLKETLRYTAAFFFLFSLSAIVHVFVRFSHTCTFFFFFKLHGYYYRSKKHLLELWSISTPTKHENMKNTNCLQRFKVNQVINCSVGASCSVIKTYMLSIPRNCIRARRKSCFFFCQKLSQPVHKHFSIVNNPLLFLAQVFARLQRWSTHHPLF